MKKVRNKQQIKSIIHYLIKWADWSFKYNSYKLISHLADALKAVVNYKHRLKYKHKKINQINIDKISDSENALHKQISRWDHVLYLIHSVLNETLKLHDIKICSRILINFWVNYIAFHLISYFFTSNCSWLIRL